MSELPPEDVPETPHNGIPQPPPPPLPPSIGAPTAQRVQHRTSDHFAPIRVHFAINRDDAGAVRSLIAARGGLDLSFVARGCTPLVLALLRDNLEIARLLIEALPPQDLLLSERTRWQRQPIHLAARAGNAELVELMVARCPAAVHATDAMLLTPLHWAAAHNRCTVVGSLLALGAHVDASDDRGRTPLHRALEGGHVGAAGLLLAAGASLEHRDHTGWTPLYQVLVCGMLPVVLYVLDAGASVRLRDSMAQTPLHVACYRAARRNIRTVSHTGLDFYTRHLGTATPPVLRALTLDPDTDLAQVVLLLEHGARVNERDAQGMTPLCLALHAGRPALARLLHAAGADLALESAWLPARDWPAPIASDTALCDWLSEAYEIKVQPLTSLCKFAIRSSVGGNVSENIYKLSLPHALQQFCVTLDDPT